LEETGTEYHSRLPRASPSGGNDR